MKFQHSIRLSAITVLMVLLGNFFLSAIQKTDGADFFDSLFPSTAYKQVLDTIMLVWEDIRLFNSGRSGLDQQACEDLIVGRLVRLNEYCALLVQERSKYTVLLEDVDYLVRVLKATMNEYDGVNQTIKQFLNEALKKCMGY
ncbi:hypothetical protein KC460_00185 [Candidatus Dependentiae bacterium]|nr:hypothetical protein [Candidatus Dependentiae bacterium]